MAKIKRIGLGGGCHWCTEAVLQVVPGVMKVEQGYIASEGEAAAFSEAVIVQFDTEVVSLKQLIRLHLQTHHSTSSHSFRKKYRSAVYYFQPEEGEESLKILEQLQRDFEKKIITEILPFRSFRASRESLQNYYKKNPEAPFCSKYIEPKLKIVRNELFHAKSAK